MKLMSRSFAVALFILSICSTDALAQLTFDKPKSEPPLPNPYPLGAKREDVLKVAREIFQTCGFPIDEVASKASDGKIVTKFVVYTRGVTTRSDLEHLATMPASTVRNWLQGRFLLEIVSLPFDQNRTQLQVSAKIQGRLGGVTEETWIDGVSNGNLEDEVLRGLAGKVLGMDLNRASRSAKGKRHILNCEY